MLYFIIFGIAMLGVGFMLGRLIKRPRKYVGNMVVTKDAGVTMFSLEMNGDPEQLLDFKEITFKVVVPSEESDRE